MLLLLCSSGLLGGHELVWGWWILYYHLLLLQWLLTLVVAIDHQCAIFAWLLLLLSLRLLNVCSSPLLVLRLQIRCRPPRVVVIVLIVFWYHKLLLITCDCCGCIEMSVLASCITSSWLASSSNQNLTLVIVVARVYRCYRVPSL